MSHVRRRSWRVAPTHRGALSEEILVARGAADFQFHWMTKPCPFRYFKTSPEIIRLAVMMYVRFPLSLHNLAGLLHERGIQISQETVGIWQNRFGAIGSAGSHGGSAQSGFDSSPVRSASRPGLPPLVLFCRRIPRNSRRSGLPFIVAQSLQCRAPSTPANEFQAEPCGCWRRVAAAGFSLKPARFRQGATAWDQSDASTPGHYSRRDERCGPGWSFCRQGRTNYQ